jgi:hypothetical protein
MSCHLTESAARSGCGHQSASQRELEGEVRQISVNGSVSEITREPISKLLTVCATAWCEG